MRTFCESGGWEEREARPWRCGGFTQGFYPLGFITLGFTSLVSTPSAFINKTGTVLFPLAFNCLCVCLDGWMDVCRHFILKVSHFVCVQGTI